MESKLNQISINKNQIKYTENQTLITRKHYGNNEKTPLHLITHCHQLIAATKIKIQSETQ